MQHTEWIHRLEPKKDTCSRDGIAGICSQYIDHHHHHHRRRQSSWNKLTTPITRPAAIFHSPPPTQQELSSPRTFPCSLPTAGALRMPLWWKHRVPKHLVAIVRHSVLLKDLVLHHVLRVGVVAEPLSRIAASRVAHKLLALHDAVGRRCLDRRRRKGL
jgi:hypothetical protein